MLVRYNRIADDNCPEKCCAGNCTLYWLAVPCPTPPQQDLFDCDGNPIPPPPTPPNYLVRQNSTCGINGPTVSVGQVIIIGGYCYRITGAQYVRQQDLDAGCAIPPSTLVSSLPSIDGALSCVADCDVCGAGNYSLFARLVPCDPNNGNPTYKFCRADLLRLGKTCLYFIFGTNPACYKASLDGPNPGVNDVLVNLYTFVTQPGAQVFDHCCECENALLACVYQQQPDFPIPNQDGAKCCCGTQANLEATTWTIIEDRYTVTGDGPGGVGTSLYIYEIVNPPIQLTYSNGGSSVNPGLVFVGKNYVDGQQVGDSEYADYSWTAINKCSPLAYRFPGSIPLPSPSPDDPTFIFSYFIDCDTVNYSATWGQYTPGQGGARFTYSFSARMTRPIINQPCVGGCPGSTVQRSPLLFRAF